MKIAAPLFLALFALGAIMLGLHLGLAAEANSVIEATSSEELDARLARLPTDTTPSPPASPDTPAAAPVVVIELFTSEGCSSCPPADRLLVDLAERDDARLFPLAFHVDYWNRLGWHDPFSAPAYSQRQRAYARASDSDRVYTPQMIVNGQTAFVGSRRREAEQAIQQALTDDARVSIALSATARSGGVRVDYEVSGAASPTVLNLVLVQRRAEQAVPRGENAGRTLEHANIVRAFESVPAGAGTQTLALPDGLDAADTMVIAYAQHPETMRISGAERVALTE